MCCAVSKQEQNILFLSGHGQKGRIYEKVMDRMASIDEEDCAPSVSIELKKRCSVISGISLWKITVLQKEFNQLMLDLEDSS